MKAATTAAADYVRERVNIYIYMCAYKCADTGGGDGAARVEGGTEPVSTLHIYVYNVYVLRRCAGYLTYPTTNSSVCRLLLLELQKLNSSLSALVLFSLCAARPALAVVAYSDELLVNSERGSRNLHSSQEAT